MQRTIELLAPGGDVDSIKAAIAAGADAVYCGLNNFNARNRATNIEVKDLNGILNLAHRNNCKVYLTINIIIVENEFRALVNLLNKLVNTSIDGIIVQDLGLFYLLAKHFKNLEIHASTQLTTHNSGQIEFLHKLRASQVNLSRELNLAEIAELTSVAHNNRIKTEIFVQGSYCLSFSGLCYMSSVLEGKSGNRGRCSQPCRDEYLTTPAGKHFPLNLKDNSAYFDLPEIAAAGVDSIKLEGRIKKFHYVYTVVEAWRDQLDRLYQKHKQNDAYGALQKVFNRDFSNGFLKSRLDKDMYIDNPRDNSARHFSAIAGCSTEEGVERSKQELHALRTEIIVAVKDRIKPLSIEKLPLDLVIAGTVDNPLTVTVKTAEGSFNFSSVAPLIDASAYSLSLNNRDQRDEKSTAHHQRPAKKISIKPLTEEVFSKKFNAINDTEYALRKTELTGLQAGLFIHSRELTSIRDRIISALNGATQTVEPVTIPRLKKNDRAKVKPTLAVLISSAKQLAACTENSAEIFFQLPSCFNGNNSELVDLFLKNKQLTPWFPSVLLGNDYDAALDILQQIKPQRIVTNNSGIAYEAFKQGIKWIAGPYLNLVNSFSLICLKETFNCGGAFISNEISKQQIAAIVSPDNFELYYSIYQPQLLLTSRQCLFQQVSGCEKELIDGDCRQSCHKSTSITNLKNESLRLTKTKGDYHHIYSSDNFFNPGIVTDLPGVFSSFLIDLRDVDQKINTAIDRARIIKLFIKFLAGDPQPISELKQRLPPTTNAQYKNGI